MSLHSPGYRDHDDGDGMCGPAAVVVPVDEYRRLRALERRATRAELDAAEADAIMAGYREWAAAGRPGAVSHDEAMAELLKRLGIRIGAGENRVVPGGLRGCAPVHGRSGGHARGRRRCGRPGR